MTDVRRETADEAQARAIAPLLKEIAGTTLLPPERLPQGCAVKVAGDWYGFRGLDGTGRMLLSDGNCRNDPFIYGPTTGELFAWASPF